MWFSHIFNIIFNTIHVVNPHIIRTFAIINFKTIYNMINYSFNPKVARRVKEIVAERTAKIVENIGPTVFDTDIQIEDKPITSLFNIINTNYQITKKTAIGRQFVMIGTEFLPTKHLLSRNAQIIIDYICINIAWCSNAIKFTKDDIMLFHNMDDHSYFNALNELINVNLIRKTTRKSVYIVNHNYLFKGSLHDFVEIYRIAYPEPTKVNAEGRIIIDDDIQEKTKVSKRKIVGEKEELSNK